METLAMETGTPVTLADSRHETATPWEWALGLAGVCPNHGIVFIERYATQSMMVRHYRTDHMEVVGFLRRFGGPRQQLSQNNGHR